MRREYYYWYKVPDYIWWCIKCHEQRPHASTEWYGNASPHSSKTDINSTQKCKYMWKIELVLKKWNGHEPHTFYHANSILSCQNTVCILLHVLLYRPKSIIHMKIQFASCCMSSVQTHYIIHMKLQFASHGTHKLLYNKIITNTQIYELHPAACVLYRLKSITQMTIQFASCCTHKLFILIM